MKKTILLSAALCCYAVLFAQKSAVYVSDEAAIKGYDAVAYFKAQKPVKGSRDLAWNWNNATWYFSTKANLDSFKTSPEKYAPQFGGYCAFGVADGHKAPTDPNAWTIVNDKLYLNYNKDVMKMWRAKQQTYITTADKNWATIKDKE